ncbi:O-antigen polysaccharide polymerase Wzy [Acinetobacter junii]|uniref:O-antigen polysaccharide polymerase Wzy n=1 Tax=Acinetobacter junii TaxID=40215 RepID=UPI0024AD5F81|nr:O-antigen polysaccharide polymerase Wzy [Acinetobacter junii]MDI6620376.1 O-antigen polysaccharide polymerase Wzy [Acinetobacter junii]
MNSVKTLNSKISFLFFLTLTIFFNLLYLTDFVLEFSDFTWSFFIILYLLCVYFFRTVNKVNDLSLFSLFYITFLLFLCGRFFSIFLGYDKSLFEFDFFAFNQLNSYEITKLMFILLSGMAGMEVGLYLYQISKKEKIKNDNRVLNINPYFSYIVSFFIITLLYTSIIKALIIAMQGDFLSLYAESQNENYSSSLSSFLTPLSLIWLGVVCIMKNKKVQKTYMFLLFFYYFLGLLVGYRGGFICFILFWVWYINDYGAKSIDVKKAFKVAVYFLMFIVFMNTVYISITFRDMSVGHSGFFNSILGLIYSQGITLMVFNESLYVNDYPIQQYFQNFLPGVSFLYNNFIETIPFYKTSWNAYLSYSLNPKMYEMGYGVGWSLFSDIYLYSFGVIFLFSSLIAIFTFFLNFIQYNINKSIFFKYIAVVISLNIFFLPRGNLSSIFPLILYALVFLFIVLLFSRVESNEK